MFDQFDEERRFREAWDAIRIERKVHFSLFTFGSSDLPYFLVTPADSESQTVSVCKGNVKIDRPQIITPYNAHPEFQNFFENADDEDFIQFLLARTAAFGNLKLSNHSGPAKIVTDTVDEAVARLNQQLDHEEEEHVAIISAPATLAGMAILRYAAERVMSSAPDNIQELRERGFLP
jgi:hypothetical protein